MKNRHYIFENSWNIRDLGGYTAVTGEKTRPYKFIRGTGSGSLSLVDKELLYNDGIRVIIDLRLPYETDKVAHSLKGYRDIRYYNVDLIQHLWPKLDGVYNDLSDLYVDVIENCQHRFFQVFEIILQNDSDGIYFSCTAGKDRTGLIAMMLLLLAGVEHSEIVANYAESFKNNLPMMERGEKPTPKQLKFFYSEPDYIKRAIALIEEKYLGIHGYLKTIGLSDHQIERLTSLIIDRN